MIKHSPTLPGYLYRSTHRASVLAILGNEAPVVLSRGSQFYNRDRWTLRFFAKELCTWAQKNPKRKPTEADLLSLVEKANSVQVPIRSIVIASTPEKLPRRTALALIGGAYHEAWHTKYTVRRALRLQEIQDLILDVWDKIADWSPLQNFLLSWMNIIEDIRIERCGVRKYPGTSVKMHDLQDFVLLQEAKSRRKYPDQWNALSTVEAVFRDAGLGYVTDTSMEAKAFYFSSFPESCELVLQGPLTEILDEAISLSPEDDLGSLRLALKVATLINPKAKKKVTDRLVIGFGKEGGKGPKKGGSEAGQGEKEKEVKGLGPKPSKEGDKTGPGEEREEPEELDSGSGTGGTEEKFPDLAESLRGKEEIVSDEKEGSEEGGSGAGGFHPDPGELEGQDFQELTQKLWGLAQEMEPLGLKDFSSSMGENVEKTREKEQSQLPKGERSWRPFAPYLDEVKVVKPSRKGKSNDAQCALQILNSVRSETAFLQARLRTIIRSMEMTGVEHGHKRGIDLSERMFVDSFTSVRSGEIPTRAFFQAQETFAMSLAAAIVIDESGSMSSHLSEATKCLMALTFPLDFLGCPTLAIGFRNGKMLPEVNRDQSLYQTFHRMQGIVIDVFKWFQEPFRKVCWRFSNTRGTGGTPMADGIQFALRALEERSEGHRVVFVITDGCPDLHHEEVIRGQIRKAKEQGMHLIGVGIGSHSRKVIAMFPDHVWTDTFQEMPFALVAKLNRLLDFRYSRRSLARASF
jgi:hypothetical protein